MSRVLIFGAGGFVGSYLCKEFLNNGYKVSGTDKGEGSALPSEVDFYKTDLMQADEVKKLIGQIQPDIIVNLAAISSVGASWNMPQTTMAINVIGALNIMEAARKSEQKPRILFVGSSEEYVISMKIHSLMQIIHMVFQKLRRNNLQNYTENSMA